MDLGRALIEGERWATELVLERSVNPIELALWCAQRVCELEPELKLVDAVLTGYAKHAATTIFPNQGEAQRFLLKLWNRYTKPHTVGLLVLVHELAKRLSSGTELKNVEVPQSVESETYVRATFLLAAGATALRAVMPDAVGCALAMRALVLHCVRVPQQLQPVVPQSI